MASMTSLSSAPRIFTTVRPAKRAGRMARPRVHMMAALVLVPSGDGKSDHLPEKLEAAGPVDLKDGSFTLGGDPKADVVLAVPTVSSSHARLEVDSGKLTVTDLGSTNGTTLDGNDLKPQEPAVVAVGSQISFGDTHLAQFKLEDRDQSTPAESAPAESAPAEAAPAKTASA